jgi:PAS domain S-box-containing protein
MTRSIATPLGQRVGSFRYNRAQERWEWSDAVARMHGYAPGQVQPTTALVMSHKHPDDAADVALLIEAMAEHGHAFSSRHRIIDTAGETHHVLVVGERMHADDGTVIGSQGFYVDISDAEDNHSVDAAIADFTAHRSVIEQAKGVLMASYNISADRAFDILVWRSQETNTKLRRIAVQLIEDFTTRLEMPTEFRRRADHLLLTAHRRIGPRPQQPDAKSDAC